MDIRIRQANISDATLLADLGTVTFHDAFASFNKEEDMTTYMQASFNKAKLAEEIATPGAVFYIAYDVEKPIGFAKTGQQQPPAEISAFKCRELERLYVLKEYQSHKIGEQLMNHCINKAKGDNTEILWLGVWENNPRAISFTSDLGFSILVSIRFN